MLRSSYGLRHCDILPWQGYEAMDPLDPFTASDLRRLQNFYPKLKSIAGHKVRMYSDLNSVYPDIKYFTLVREPLKRYASHYQFIKRNRQLTMGFEEWVESNDWGPNWQTRMLTGTDNIDEAIRRIQGGNILVGLVERFDEAVVLVKGLLDNSLDISYERKNVSTDNTLANEILQNERTHQILIEQNRVDLQLYNYVKEELYPDYQRGYGERLEENVAAFRQNRGRFNRGNVVSAHLYRNLVYKQALRLYRRQFRTTKKVNSTVGH
jgi:hypothetical protein